MLLQQPEMPRSDEAAAFFTAVYQAVQEIPHGKVTSYGHIARLIGTRKTPSLCRLDHQLFRSLPLILTSKTSTTATPGGGLPEVPL